MELSKQSIWAIADAVSVSLVNVLEQRGLIGNTAPGRFGKSDKTAYQKTEQLLYNYRGFCRIVEERMQEIEDIRKYGVPQRCGASGERVQNGNLPQGIVLPEESVESAVRTVQDSVQDTVRVIALIDKCMAALAKDPYYKILEMFYFERRTQEDIALEYNCDQTTVSRNKNRLVKEMAMRIFPNDVINEYMN